MSYVELANSPNAQFLVRVAAAHDELVAEFREREAARLR